MAQMANMSAEAQGAWDRLTQILGYTPDISSAYRDPATNARVGGAKGSQHLHGNAFDTPTAGMSPEQITHLIKSAKQAGFTGFGGYDRSVHFDVGPARTWGPTYRSDSTPEYLSSALGGEYVAADTMRALGKGPQMEQMTQAAPQQDERKGFLGGLLGDPERRAKLSMMLEGMTLNPNQGVIEAAKSTLAEGARRRDTNKTVEMLQRMGADPKLIELAQAGYAKEAVGLAYAKPKEKYTTMTGAQINAQYGTGLDEKKLYNVSPTGQITQVGGSGVTVNNAGGSPSDQYFKDAAGDLAKQMAGVRSAGAVAAANIGTLQVLRDLYEVSPSGEVVGRFAEIFPEMSDTTAVINSLKTQLAPQLRVEGSGSTSDIEYAGMLNSLGSFRNRPEANKAIINMMLAKMELNAAKAKIAAQVRPGPGGLDPYDAMAQMQALEEQMWVQNPAVAQAKALGRTAPVARGSEPVTIDGVTIQRVD